MWQIQVKTKTNHCYKIGKSRIKSRSVKQPIYNSWVFVPCNLVIPRYLRILSKWWWWWRDEALGYCEHDLRNRRIAIIIHHPLHELSPPMLLPCQRGWWWGYHWQWIGTWIISILSIFFFEAFLLIFLSRPHCKALVWPQIRSRPGAPLIFLNHICCATLCRPDFSHIATHCNIPEANNFAFTLHFMQTNVTRCKFSCLLLVVKYATYLFLRAI